jgi:CBS domain-containing protein
MATQWDENIQGAGPERAEGRRGATPEVRAQRSESRAAQTYTFFLRDLEAKGLDRKLARQAIQSVLCVMEQRLMSEEARHLEAQLPRKVVELLERCPKHQGKQYRKFGRDEFLGMVAEELGVDIKEAERITCVVLSTVREHISEGEAEDVLGQLPRELRDLWMSTGSSATKKHDLRARRRTMGKRISEVMTKDVEVVHPNDTLRDCAEKMRTLNVGPMPVCDGQRLKGIITDRDIVVRAVSQGMDPNTTRVSQAMTDQVEYIFDDEDLEVAARRMQEEQIRRLLVVDRDKKLVGIIALGDISQATSEEKAGETLEAISEPSHPAMH